jgi:hypothetical protein
MWIDGSMEVEQVATATTALPLDLSPLESQRRHLGMSRMALARRSGVPLQTVPRTLAGNQPLASVAELHAIANALGMGIGTEIVVERSALDMRKAQALAKATRLVGMGQATMALEAQAVEASVLKQMIERTVCELLAGSPRRLWGE